MVNMHPKLKLAFLLEKEVSGDGIPPWPQEGEGPGVTEHEGNPVKDSHIVTKL